MHIFENGKSCLTRENAIKLQPYFSRCGSRNETNFCKNFPFQNYKFQLPSRSSISILKMCQINEEDITIAKNGTLHKRKRLTLSVSRYHLCLYFLISIGFCQEFQEQMTLNENLFSFCYYQFLLFSASNSAFSC